MKKEARSATVTACVFFFMLAGCATQRPQMTFQPEDLNGPVEAGTLAQKVDAFMVILDASSSMGQDYEKTTKMAFAEQVVVGMNRTIPDLEIVGALRTVGDTFCPVIKKTTLIHGPASHDKKAFEAAAQTVGWPGGRTPLAEAITAAGEDLNPVTGQIALIIVSDGEDLNHTPVAAAESLKSEYGNRICIYTVVTGAGKTLMDKIAQAGECGFSVAGSQLASATRMADFVERVFLKKSSGPMDSDGDGVYDGKDQCPNTARGIRVDRTGCPLDSDGDGVYDHEDRCPDTPQGISVDVRGCPLDTDRDGVYDYLDACPGTPSSAQVSNKGCWILEGLRFDTGKSRIKPESYPILNEVLTVLKRNPDLKIRIEGHTDNVGKQAYNQKLSEERAEAVKAYLLNVGIAEERLSSQGYGFTRPVATNETAKGRAQNRRVELTPVP